MRIYPDPELPDVHVEWLDQDCRDGDETVVLAIDGVDSTSHSELSVPCTDVKTTLKDMKRERFHITGELRRAASDVITTAEYDVDLRSGLDQNVFLYFGAYDGLRIAWVFDMGATCESVGALQVFINVDGEEAYAMLCAIGQFSGMLPPGDHTLDLVAKRQDGTPVAQSQPVDVTVVPDLLTDVGVVTLFPL